MVAGGGRREYIPVGLATASLPVSYTHLDVYKRQVLLTADASLDLRANPDRDARGVAIEANLDKGRGATATVLIQSGTLHVGDAIVTGSSYGRVRAMLDEHGDQVSEATPSRPVQVLGLSLSLIHI